VGEFPDPLVIGGNRGNHLVHLQFRASMAIEKNESFVVLKHPSGASVKILKYGATVIEWKLPNGTENLFLSTLTSYRTLLTIVPQS
jgi:D-hexose-6-phosphate mutarotase